MEDVTLYIIILKERIIMGLGCLALSALILSPRIIIVFQWLFGQAGNAYDTILWPILGFIFMPWTTVWVTYVLSGGSFNSLWEWAILGVAVAADVGAHVGASKEGYDYNQKSSKA